MSLTQTKASELLERHRDYIFPAVSPLYGDQPLAVARAKDQYVWDTEGERYLDFFGGVLTVSVGHCNDDITAATIEQLQTAQHTSTLYINETMVRLAEKVASLTPGRLQKCFFTSSGSEANETALMAARMYTGNSEVVTLRHAYSGRTMTTMSLTAHGTWRLGGVFDGTIKHVRNPYTYRAPLGLNEDQLVDLCVQDLEETLATVTSGKIAAFMAEPIQGVGGFIVAPETYFKRILPIVREAGGLLIIDEVQTGWGRTGHHWCGIEHWGVEPDIMTFAKGMANGSPIGCTIATPEVAEAVQGLTFATFGGNPVTMATALATIEYIEKHNLPDNAAEQGRGLRERLEHLQQRYPFIGDVRGMGLMQALEIVEPGEDKTPDKHRTAALINAARDHGLLIGKGGLYGNVIRISPHLNVSREDLETGCTLLEKALADVA
ncbi:MAG: aspartate aminotransferase family protein [Trueperaceae bacterium]|nr:aspartate aminotransferase family protein [Trueperaceae bacterium]